MKNLKDIKLIKIAMQTFLEQMKPMKQTYSFYMINHILLRLLISSL